jgi:hypothetical protein
VERAQYREGSVHPCRDRTKFDNKKSRLPWPWFLVAYFTSEFQLFIFENQLAFKAGDQILLLLDSTFLKDVFGIIPAFNFHLLLLLLRIQIQHVALKIIVPVHLLFDFGSHAQFVEANPVYDFQQLQDVSFAYSEAYFFTFRG